MSSKNSGERWYGIFIQLDKIEINDLHLKLNNLPCITQTRSTTIQKQSADYLQ